MHLQGDRFNQGPAAPLQDFDGQFLGLRPAVAGQLQAQRGRRGRVGAARRAYHEHQCTMPLGQQVQAAQRAEVGRGAGGRQPADQGTQVCSTQGLLDRPPGFTRNSRPDEDAAGRIDACLGQRRRIGQGLLQQVVCL